jgi:hypothetical protein
VPAGMGSKLHDDSWFAIGHHFVWIAALRSFGNPRSVLKSAQPILPLLLRSCTSRTESTAVVTGASARELVALATVDLNIARVRTRVEAGGHDVPEAKIRERWQRSHDNLVSLLPLLDELLVFDNSDIPPLLVAQKAGGTLTVLRTDRLPHLLVRLRPPA